MSDILVQHVTLSCGCTLLVSTSLAHHRVTCANYLPHARMYYWHEPPQRAIVEHERTATDEEKERLLE